MRNFVLIIPMLLVATPALADDGYINANAHVLAGDDIVTGEYDWASGRFSGYGFVDKSLKGDFVITDHEVRAQVAGPFYVNAEVGYNHFGGAMGDQRVRLFALQCTILGSTRPPRSNDPAAPFS